MLIRKRRAAPAALLAAATIAAAPMGAQARSAAGEAGLGTACAMGNLIYGPTKMMYAFFGGFIGLVAFGLSAGDEDVAMRVIEPAWRGDYALTPQHLTGERELEFFGRRGAHEAARGGGEEAVEDADGGAEKGERSGW
jgi:hypothetical protein